MGAIFFLRHKLPTKLWVATFLDRRFVYVLVCPAKKDRLSFDKMWCFMGNIFMNAAQNIRLFVIYLKKPWVFASKNNKNVFFENHEQKRQENIHKNKATKDKQRLHLKKIDIQFHFTSIIWNSNVKNFANPHFFWVAKKIGNLLFFFQRNATVFYFPPWAQNKAQFSPREKKTGRRKVWSLVMGVLVISSNTISSIKHQFIILLWNIVRKYVQRKFCS